MTAADPDYAAWQRTHPGYFAERDPAARRANTAAVDAAHAEAASQQAAERGYVPCPHDCGHYLCYMERQWDECPGCAGALPDWLKLDADLKPI